MAVSRLRLRLAFAFSVSFAAGLALLAAVALGYLWSESHRRLDARLERLTSDVRVSLAFESQETPDSTQQFVASEVVAEWPRNGGSFVVCDSAGNALAATDTSQVVRVVERRCGNAPTAQFDVTDGLGRPIRALARQFHLPVPGAMAAANHHVFGVVAFASTSGISEDSELLLAAIGIAAPVILLLSMTGGYFVARGALRPVVDLSVAISNIAPSELSQRLDVKEPRDEVGILASEFNGLLARLHSAQTQNRRFLREAAHQIRTPLTLVLGEAGYGLATEGASMQRMGDSLKRIGLAAERMRRRVDDLFLLAEAQTGEPVTLGERVELDGLVLDAVDLMRPRSTALGRALAIGRAHHVVVKGNTALLQEALLELLENALRHGDGTCAVTVAAFEEGLMAVLEVESGGSLFALPVADENAGPQGLGLPIVRWVAEVHGGELMMRRHGDRNILRMAFPKLAER